MQAAKLLAVKVLADEVVEGRRCCWQVAKLLAAKVLAAKALAGEAVEGRVRRCC